MNTQRLVVVLIAASVPAGCLASGFPTSPAEAGPTTAATASPGTTTSTTTTTVPPLGAPTTTSPPTTSPPTTSPPTTSPPTTSPPTTAVSPARVLASAISAAAGQRAVDWTQTVAAGLESYTQTTHAGRLDGTSSITLRVGKTTLKLNWILIGKTVYFDGNSGALTDALGFTTAAAKAEAGKWISATASAGTLFQDLSSYLTVSSATSILDLVGEMTFLPATTVRGVTVLGIQGIRLSEQEKVTETIYVKATGTPLPVELSQTQQGATGYTYFGPWGQPPAAKAPPGALKLSKTWLTSP